MLILRIVALLAVIGMGVAAMAWVFTGNRKYLKVAWRIFQVVLVAALLFLVLLFFERLLVII